MVIISNILNFFSGKLTYILLGALGIITVSFGGYYLLSSSKISKLEKANVEMTIAIEAQKDTISRLRKANTDIQKANAQVRLKEGALRTRVVALEMQLKNVFRKDATKETIEKEVRKIEQDRLRCLEIITGSTISEKDKANSICPPSNTP